MTPEKVIAQTRLYEEQLRGLHIPKVRIDTRRTFASLTLEERLAHAHHLCGGIPDYARSPDQWGKTCRHYGSLQTILSFADWLTLEDMMSHNKAA